MAFNESQLPSGDPYQRQQHSVSPLPQQQQQPHFLVPQQMQRSRSLSDTSSRPPVWDTMPMHQGSGAEFDVGSHDGGRGVSVGTVNMNDVLPGPSGSSTGTATGTTNPTASGTGIHSPPPSAGIIRHTSSAGPHTTSFGSSLTPQHFASPHLSTNDFLSPNDPGATYLRRVKSESVRGHHRQVRSEDLGYLTPHHNQQQQQQQQHMQLYPPPSASSREILSRQYLHPSETIPSITRGHHRRSSSGSRERGLMGVGGWSSGGSSARPSPYPSPSASPRPGYGALPEVVQSIGGSHRRSGLVPGHHHPLATSSSLSSLGPGSNIGASTMGPGSNMGASNMPGSNM
ncbi:hypothetical protein K474DRAFT_1614507, partial [Panus rudis PR-1116 ss-1]